MALLQGPDVYGYTIFCDDIRQEVGGKLSFMGAYSGTMIVHLPFPAQLPTFAMGITLLQRASAFVSKVGLRVSLPGDPEDAPSIQAEAADSVESAAAAAVSAEEDASGSAEDGYLSLNAHLKFVQLVIKQPGLIKVRAAIGDNLIRLGSLRVSAPPQMISVLGNNSPNN
jgi:hypothetical protein